MTTDSFHTTVGASAEEGPLDAGLRVVADAFDVDPPYVPEENDLDLSFPDRFLDRELSWLRLNQRVLELAEDESIPLLERVRFLAIFFIAAHAQFQGQGRGLVAALAGSAVLVPIAALRGAPIHGNMLAFYESIFVVTALATALTAGNIRLAETTGRLRARQVSRHMIETESEIRRRVAESIHDGPVQELVSLDMILTAVSSAIGHGDQAAAHSMLEEARSITERNIQALRDEIDGLGPYAFRELSFETAITDCVPVWHRRFGLDVRLELEPVSLSPDISGPLFLIAQEAVTNAGRHAQADHVTVSLSRRNGEIRLRVADDGKGFGDVWPLAGDTGHIGLSSMRERAEMVNGSLTIDSGGRGTVVTVRLPLQAAPKEL